MAFICCYSAENDLWALSYSVSRLVHNYLSILALFSICVTQSGVLLCYSFHHHPSHSAAPSESEHWWQKWVGLVVGILPSPHPSIKGSNCWICNSRYGAPVWFLPFPDFSGEAAAADRDLMSPVGCRNNSLQLKTCTEPLGANTRVLWIIGHSVLLSRALWARWYLEVPFLLHLQPVTIPLWLRWRGYVKCFIGLGPGSEIKDRALVTGGFFEKSIYCTANESRTQNFSSWY